MVFDSLLNVLGANDEDLTAAAASNARASIIADPGGGQSAEEVGEAMIAGQALNATPGRRSRSPSVGGKQVDQGQRDARRTRCSTSTGPATCSFTIVRSPDEAIVDQAFAELP